LQGVDLVTTLSPNWAQAVHYRNQISVPSHGCNIYVNKIELPTCYQVNPAL
jgi:hypothetical protein